MTEEIENIISKAALAKKSNWIQALTILENGLQKFPTNPQLLENLGDMYFSKQNNNKAADYYKRANDAEPGKESVLHKLANLRMLDFNFLDAKSYLEKINNPSNAAIFKKAVCCVHLQISNQAISLLESIKNDQINPEAVSFLLCEQYIATKDFAKAKSLLNSLEKTFFNNSKITFLWGFYYFRQNKWLPAYDNLLQAKKQGFNFLGNIKILAISAYQLGLYTRAIDYYRKALKFSPFDSSIFEHLIKIYLHLGQREKAKIISKRIPVFVPKSPKLLNLINELLQS